MYIYRERERAMVYTAHRPRCHHVGRGAIGQYIHTHNVLTGLTRSSKSRVDGTGKPGRCCPGFYLFAPFVLSPPRGALVVLPRPVLLLL